jgi:hypothetical protein
LERISAARELEIASRPVDGRQRRWLPIWVVCVDDQAYRAKYGTPGDATVAGMTTSASAATTLVLAPAGASSAAETNDAR